MNRKTIMLYIGLIVLFSGCARSTVPNINSGGFDQNKIANGNNVAETINNIEGENMGNMSDTIVKTDDNTLYVSDIGSAKDGSQDGKLRQLFESLDWDKVAVESINKIIVGDASFSVKVDLENRVPVFSGVEVYSRSVDVSGFKDRRMFGNFRFQAFWSGEVFVFGTCDWWGSVVCFVTPEGEARYVYNGNREGAWYDQEKCSFFKDEDGSIIYSKTLAKFDDIQATGGQLEYCYSKDEVYREEGRVKVSSGDLEYEPTSSETISEVFDMNELYKLWINTMDLDPSVSLDEFLLENQKKYGK